MDVRGKLVELVHNARMNALWHNAQKPDEYITDMLMEGGVTVQQCGYWISLTDCANAGVYCSVCNKKVYKEDYAWCNRKNKLRSDYCPHCGAKNVAPAAERRMNDDTERSN